MIVEFSVRNFRSIKDLQTISFRATGLKSPEELSYVDSNNICSIQGERILKTVGIYGANGSGKSNVIRALDFFIKAVTAEASPESNLNSLCDPFLFQDFPEHSEIFFQIVLFIGDKKFRYGFTLERDIEINDKNKSVEIVTKEWLFGTVNNNMSEYFTRTGKRARTKKPINSDKIPTQLPYNHTIFLTHASAFDSDGICTKIREYLRGLTISNFSDGFSNFRWNSFLAIEQESKKKELLDLLSVFNLKYDNITVKRGQKSEDEDDYHSLSRIDFYKNTTYNDNLRNIKLNLIRNESAGTQRLFEIAGFLIRAFDMPVGGLIIVDEIDSNFHPALLRKLICLFNDPQVNRSRCQLLFTSHDTNLLSPELLRRDQVYFTEKQEDESTRLYSLADLRGIRNDADFAKQYLAGMYGGIPILGHFFNHSVE